MDFAQQLMSKFVFANNYAQYDDQKGRRLTHPEQIEKIRETFTQFYLTGNERLNIRAKLANASEEVKAKVKAYINEGVDGWIAKKATGSNRVGQLAGDPILKNNNRVYNCSYSPCNRVEFFAQCIYMLLCGTGTGFSVQRHHIDQLPLIHPVDKSRVIVHYVQDSIEGWADALDALVCSYFDPKGAKQYGQFEAYFGANVVFDYSLVRKKGAKINGGIGRAPGAEPLALALENCRRVLDLATENGARKIKTIEAYDVVMHAADCVRAGGIRRSACLTMFSLNDDDMMKAKTGNWFETNAQRARSNNSVVLVREEVTQQDFETIFQYTQQFGEPAFIFVDDKEVGLNPCMPKWAKVVTKDGLRTIEDIKAGDEIWSEDGWVTVKKKWSTGIKDVFRYRTTAGVFYGTENHRIVQDGIKIEVGKAVSIDPLRGPSNQPSDLEPVENQDVIDGLVVGDGSSYEMSIGKPRLYIGSDDVCYLDDPNISSFIGKKYGCDGSYMWEVSTTITTEELPLTYERRIPERFLANRKKLRGFLRGLYSANGSLVANRITFKTSCKALCEDVQVALSSLGIASYYTTNKAKDVTFRNGTYTCKESYDINITSDRELFRSLIGFIHPYKMEKLNKLCEGGAVRKNKSYDIIEIDHVSNEEVFDITVSGKHHTFWNTVCNVSNCVEAGFYPYLVDKDLWGWQLCNLSSINMAGVNTIEEWKARARIAAILGTLQAGFTDFDYVGRNTKEITEREALLGISMTAMSHSPIAFDKNQQREVMEYCKTINEELAGLLGINPAARLAAIKPEGTGTLALGETASGCHDDHAPQYIRRITGQKDSPLVDYIRSKVPAMIEESFWSKTGTDVQLLFPIDLSDKKVTFKREVSAEQFLTRVKDSVEGWIRTGHVAERCVNPKASHSVSNTVPIFAQSDFDVIKRFVWDNKSDFVGVSTAGVSGDYSYVDSPLVECEQKLYDENDVLADWYRKAEDIWHKGCYADVISSADTFAVLGYSWDTKTEQIKPSFEAYSKVSSQWGTEKMAFYRALQGLVAEYCLAMGKVDGVDDVNFEEKLGLFIKKLWTRERYNLLRKQIAETPMDFSEVLEIEDVTTVNGEIACAGGACLI